MKKYEDRSKDILDIIKGLQEIETRNIQHVRKDIPKTRNPFIKAMLEVLALESEKRSLLQQVIADSLEKEAVHLSPDELQYLSGHVNTHVGAAEESLALVKGALEKSELPIPRYLLSYLGTDLKKDKDLIRQFDDELKAASIPTSVSARASGTRAA